MGFLSSHPHPYNILGKRKLAARAKNLEIHFMGSLVCYLTYIRPLLPKRTKNETAPQGKTSQGGMRPQDRQEEQSPKHCRAGGRGSFSQQPGQGNKAHLGLSTTPSHQGTMARNTSRNGAANNVGPRSIQRPWPRTGLPRTRGGAVGAKLR